MTPIKLFLVFIILTVSASEQIVISTTQGMLRGVKHSGYVSYHGIPYATIADNVGRFKRAGLAPFWSGIRDSRASKCSPVLIQDCLQLDVYTPTGGGSDWPVLVWVTAGTGPYNPCKMVQEGIIGVVVYHRHGPAGFLCADNEVAPGNTGVKDVVLALRWIRDNIVAFRGNPAKVVIAGQGFGAAIVESIILSPMSDGLYHGAILQSGSILNPWAFNYDAKKRALDLLEQIAGDGDGAKVLLNVNIGDLVAKSNSLDVPYFPFAICLDKPMKKEERLLFGTAHDLLSTKKHNVPMMIGFNNNEAYVFVSLLKEAQVMRRLSEDIRILLPDELKFLNEREANQVARQVEDMYFKINISKASVLAYHRDAYFINHIHRSVQFHVSASNAPIYYYEFSYYGNLGVQSEPGFEKTGAAHSDELAYLFNDDNLEGDDGIVHRKLVTFWTNFVKFLNPTPPRSEMTWEAVRLQQIRLLEIGAEIKMTDYNYAKASKMWEDIYEKFYFGRNSLNI